MQLSDFTTTVKVTLITAFICGLVIGSNARADETKPFISASYIRSNHSDVVKPHNGKMETTQNFATLKVGIVYRTQNGLSVDLNLFHESDPSNGTLGNLKEGDSGVDGVELTVRKEF